MNVLNAIAKVRFNSARAQRVQLHKGPAFGCELLCLEPRQSAEGPGGCGYYVIAGTGEIASGQGREDLSPGHFAACGAGEPHTLTNTSEQRLICLVISHRP